MTGKGSTSGVAASSSPSSSGSAAVSGSSVSSAATPSLFAKALNRNSASWTKEEVADVVFWMRLALSIVTGLLWGFIPLTGIVGFVGFAVVQVVVPSVYVQYYMRNIREKLYGGLGGLLKEATMPALALFLLTWIITFTLTFFY